MIFKKKEKIEFFSKVSGVAETFPIVPAAQFKARWMEVLKEDYKKYKNTTIPSHLQMCPGIFDIYQHGYLVPMWHDVIIKTDHERQDFDWVLPSQSLTTLKGGDAVGTHPYDIGKWLPKRPQSKHAILKLNTPWHVIAPKGVKFMVLPVPYTDTYDFESCIGVLDPAISTEVNIQGYWNVNSGERLIKAGTPLMMLVPLTENNYNYETRDMNEHDKKWIDKRNYIYIFGFKVDKQRMKKAYYKHFKGE